MNLDPQGIIQHIELQAKTHPHVVAAWHRQQTMSYQQLHDASVQLALRLQAEGVTAGSVVGLCVRPCFDLLVSILAIFRCSAVYLPLDPDHPEAHVQRIVEEARPRLIIREDGRLQAGHPTDPIWNQVPAYLMYTSGTTGQPKGVMISPQNLHFYLQAAQNAFGFKASDIFCNVARSTFSISLFDLLLPLTVGASVRLLDRTEIFELSQLTTALSQSTVLHAGPSLLATLFRYLRSSSGPLKNLRHVSTGGDTVLPQVMEGMKEFFPEAELFVIYGTTEISCMGTTMPLVRGQKLSTTLVGKPFPGVAIRLLDGEICFAGSGIGEGYLQNPTLTADRFAAIDGERFYRTGDYGRLHADGNLEVIGRRDFQVQLRGVRVELTGIENCVLELGLASHCVVVHRRSGDDSGFLLAFLAGATHEDAGYVRRQMSERLPAEMVPGRILFLSTLPTTFNGKLDRRKLMNWPLDCDKVAEDTISDLEKTILQLLRTQLDCLNFGRDQNFFEAGGHSLLAILVLSLMSEEHGILIPPAVFFQTPTARQLADYWQKQSAAKPSAPCHTLPLNAPTRKKSIFFVAGAPIYRPLAQALDQNWSAFGLISEQEWHPSRAVSTESMEVLARDYARSILEQQRHGPYYLLGYSFAGILAFEVARQLTAAGHEVKRLFLLDATLPESVFRWRHGLLTMLRILRTHPADLFAYMRRKFHKRRSIPDPRTATLEKDRGHRNSVCAQDYMKRMTSYTGETVLFVAGERLKQKPLRSRTCGWRPYIPQLKVITTPSDHLSLIEDPESIQQIIREIQACAD